MSKSQIIKDTPCSLPSDTANRDTVHADHCCSLRQKRSSLPRHQDRCVLCSKMSDPSLKTRSSDTVDNSVNILQQSSFGTEIVEEMEKR